MLSDAHLNNLSSDGLTDSVASGGVRNKGVCQLGKSSSASQVPKESHIAGIVSDACDVARQYHRLLHLSHSLGDGCCC